ncbi:MAG: ATP-binding protein [Acidobacteriaceae bacterium]
MAVETMTVETTTAGTIAAETSISATTGHTEVATSSSSAPEIRKLYLLLLENSSMDRALILQELRIGGFEVTYEVIATAAQLRTQLQRKCPDVVLANYSLVGWEGIEALPILREQCLDVPLIIVSDSIVEMKAVECIKRGASDYVRKESLWRLSISVTRALQERDLKNDRKLEKQHLAEKVEELARSNHDLEQFAYVASHDLQEPLRMVAAYTQLLAEGYGAQLDEQAKKYIHYAVDGATRMQTLIQDLLTYSRTGGPVLERQETDTAQILAQTLDNLQAAIRENGAIVTSENLPVIAVNGSQLRQVFQNLLSNALKFTGEEAPLIHISAQNQSSEWLFSVADNGIGIDPAHAKVIFAVFQRLHTRAEYSGNGIGLAICKKIIERHGGKIWVERALGMDALLNSPSQ